MFESVASSEVVQTGDTLATKSECSFCGAMISTDDKGRAVAWT